MNKTLISTFAFLLWFSGPSFAQWTVHDPANFIQNMNTALNTAKTLKNAINQTENQLKQMRQDFEYMQKQLQSLGELGWEDSYKLNEHIRFFEGLKDKTDSLTRDYRKLDSNFRDLYKVKGNSMDQQYAKWSQQTDESILEAMKSHGAVDFSGKRLRSIESVINAQRRAQGDLAAIQALGELNRIQSQQLEELKTIVALDSRAKQSRAMEEISTKKATIERQKALLQGFSKDQKRKPMKEMPPVGGK